MATQRCKLYPDHGDRADDTFSYHEYDRYIAAGSWRWSLCRISNRQFRFFTVASSAVERGKRWRSGDDRTYLLVAAYCGHSCLSYLSAIFKTPAYYPRFSQCLVCKTSANGQNGKYACHPE